MNGTRGGDPRARSTVPGRSLKAPNAKRGRCCHRPRLRFRPGSLDPGRFPIEPCRSKLQHRSIRDGQSKLRSSLQTWRGKPRFRLSDVFPASRRLSFRLFSIGRTRFPDRPFLSGRTLRVPFGLPSSKLSGRPFALPSPGGSGPAGLRKSGFGFGFPRRLALLPGCPTRASLASFPKDLGPLGTGGVAEVHAVSGRPSLTAKGQSDSPPRVAPRGIWAVWPVDNVDNEDKSAESASRQSVDSSRCFRSLASSWPRRTDS